MKKSFDDIFKEKLGDFEMSPPKDLKAAILASSAPKKALDYRFLYLTVALSFLLFSFYPTGKIRKHGNVSHDSIESPINYNASLGSKNSLQPDASSHSDFDSQKPSNQKNDTPKPLSLANNQPYTIKKSDSQSSSYSESKNELTASNLVPDGEIKDKTESQYYLTTLKNLGIAEYELSLPTSLFTFNSDEKESIIPEVKKEKSFHPYFNIGTFLNYNKVSPKIEDDIYVDAYDAPVSFSPKRLGLSLEAGMQKQWTEKIAFRLGASFNNFNQNYSFSVRSTKPEYLEADASGDFFVPVFEEEKIEINKRVSMIGLKGQMLWQIFPNIDDVLYTSIEYQYLLGEVPQFNYDEVNYRLMQSSQYLVELGFRKIIVKGKLGALYMMPSLRYSMNKSSNTEALSVKPFSAGLTLSYGFN